MSEFLGRKREIIEHDDVSDEPTYMLDNTVPLGEFLDEQLARVRENEIIETDIIEYSDD